MASLKQLRSMQAAQLRKFSAWEAPWRWRPPPQGPAQHTHLQVRYDLSSL